MGLEIGPFNKAGDGIADFQQSYIRDISRVKTRAAGESRNPGEKQRIVSLKSSRAVSKRQLYYDLE